MCSGDQVSCHVVCNMRYTHTINVPYLILFSHCFSSVSMKGVEEISGEAVPDKSQYEKYVVAPSMFKAVVGTYNLCVRTYNMSFIVQFLMYSQMDLHTV